MSFPKTFLPTVILTIGLTLAFVAGGAVLVYLNEENFAGAIKPTGFYTIADGVVTVRVSLYRDGKKIGEPFDVAGVEKEIVDKLLTAIRQKLAVM